VKKGLNPEKINPTEITDKLSAETKANIARSVAAKDAKKKLYDMR
jgi:hypothetical protein